MIAAIKGLTLGGLLDMSSIVLHYSRERKRSEKSAKVVKTMNSRYAAYVGKDFCCWKCIEGGSRRNPHRSAGTGVQNGCYGWKRRKNGYAGSQNCSCSKKSSHSLENPNQDLDSNSSSGSYKFIIQAHFQTQPSNSKLNSSSKKTCNSAAHTT